MSKENDDDQLGIYGSKEWKEVVQGLGLVSIDFQRRESVIKMVVEGGEKSAVLPSAPQIGHIVDRGSTNRPGA